MALDIILLPYILPPIIIVAGLCTIDACVYLVAPGETAIVSRQGQIIETGDAGLHVKWPIIEQMTIYDQRNHTVILDVNGQLSDGSNCDVQAKYDFRVEDPIAAFKYEFSKQTKINYQEPQVHGPFKTALENKIRATSPEQALKGSLEKWIYGFSSSENKNIAEDGTRILLTIPKRVTCSNESKRVCESSYTSENQKFTIPHTFSFTEVEESIDQLTINVDELTILIGNEEIAEVKNFKADFLLIDTDKFVSRVGGIKFARSPLRGILDSALRRSLAYVPYNELASYDFQNIFSEDEFDGLDELGFVISTLDLSEARFSTRKVECKYLEE